MSLADAKKILDSARDAMMDRGPMPWKARVFVVAMMNKLLCETSAFEAHIVECRGETVMPVCKHGEQEDCNRIAAICDEMDELMSIIKYIDEPSTVTAPSAIAED